MSRISKITELFLFILLILVVIYAVFFIQNRTASYLILAASLVVFVAVILFVIFRKRARDKEELKIINETPKVKAGILAVKPAGARYTVLQLLVGHPDREYVTGITIKNTFENQNVYTVGQNINVHIDPKDQYHVVIPQTIRVASGKSKKINWFLLIYVPIISSSVVLPLVINLFDTSDRRFNDVQFIKTDENPGNIWEVRCKSSGKLFINIYDPLTNNKVKAIKDKKANVDNYSANFYIHQQGKNVYIVGIGETPVMDIYDAVNFKKISDIQTFQKTDAIFAKGISEIQKQYTSNKFSTDDMYAITTNDGNKCYYDILKNKFIYTEDELYKYSQEKADRFIKDNKFVFALSAVPNSVEKHQLYVVRTADTNSFRTLTNLAGANSLNAGYYLDKRNNYGYEHFDLIPLCSDTYFLSANIMYFDESLVIVMHQTAISKDAEVLISGIDVTGRTLFTIRQHDFPNIDDMIENNYYFNDARYVKITRSGNQIIFFFGEYGGICIDVQTGKTVWKFES
ncbi:MAG TPA: hypothetical protein PKW80_11605 [Bacteroidales bacterium]|nr:hypothetical protein [Bacteroidales bacterium]